MKRFRLIAAVSILALTGCITAPPGSWVEGIQPGDGPIIAGDLTAYLSTVLPPGHSTLAIVQPLEPPASLIETELETDLRRRGFALAPPGGQSLGSHSVRYVIAPSDLGLSVRLDADAIEATRVYTRTTTGLLQPAGPFVVRQ